MSMGIGTNARKPDEGKLKRDSLCEIACGVWFTSTGTAMPKMIKYQDDEGMIHSISQIHVQTREKKYYCGIPIHEYRCRHCGAGAGISLPVVLLCRRKSVEIKLGKRIMSNRSVIRGRIRKAG